MKTQDVLHRVGRRVGTLVGTVSAAIAVCMTHVTPTLAADGPIDSAKQVIGDLKSLVSSDLGVLLAGVLVLVAALSALAARWKLFFGSLVSAGVAWGFLGTIGDKIVKPFEALVGGGG